MSLQLILGNAGSGKTHYLYERVIKEAMEHPERNYLVIVPEQFTMATQKELVMRHPKGGILNIDVLSFGRLAHRIFEEVGRDYEGVLDDEGKNLILRKIAGDYENQLKVLGSNLKKFGYISEVKSVISEFTQYNIGRETLEELKAKVPQNSMLGYKLEDISKIYEGFYQFLEEKYITGEELLGKLSSVVKDSEILKDSVITFDGFTGFTPVQESLLGEMMKTCSGIYMTITMDVADDFYGNISCQDLFSLSKETIENMTRMAKANGISVEKPVVLLGAPVYRFKENKPMAFLEQELFRYRSNHYAGKQEAIKACVLSNPEEEARWVAGEIKALVRKEGYRYQDIAIIASSIEAYGTHLKRACEQYQIPVFSDQKRSILLNAFVEYVRSVLAMVEKGYTYETVFRFLKSGFAPLSMKQVDALETYVLSRGITGYKKWQAPFVKDSEYIKEKEVEYLNESRVLFVEAVQELQFVLTQGSKTVEDICMALYTLFLNQQMQEKIATLEADLEEEGNLALAKEYNQIYGVVLELFDKFVLLLGDEKVSLKEFNDLFDAGLQEARIGVIPPSIDAVVIGDMTRTRMGNVKTVFFVGNNDIHLPGSASSNGLLSEGDRAWFHSQDIRLKPSSKEQMYIQKFYLYLILTKPSERLYISFSKTSSQGKSVRPSYLMGELRKLFPSMKVKEEVMELETQEFTPEMGLFYLVEGLRDKELQENPAWKELYLWYQKHEIWQSQIDMLVSANQYRKSDDALTKAIAKQLYGDVLKNSVTRLERFSGCPFAHFLSYGLKVKERDMHEFQAVDLGNVFHTAMELYSKKMQEEKQDWKTLDIETQRAWANEVVESSVQDYGYALLFKSERDQYNIERIKRLMKRSVWAVGRQLACGSFEPEGYEVEFGQDPTLASANIMLAEGQKMILRGKIDRVDTFEEDDQAYVKILDYKTGAKKLSLSELYQGLQLQLFVYLNAAKEIQEKKMPHKRVVPAGVLYYQIQDPIVEVADESQDVETSLLHELTPDGLVNSGANVIDLMDRDMEEKSYAIPVSRTSKGEMRKTSKAISEADFETISEFTKKKVQEIGQQIVSGDISITPYKEEKKTGCEYCRYNQICGFDTNIPGFEYRKITGAKMEESLGLMKEEIGGE